MLDLDKGKVFIHFELIREAYFGTQFLEDLELLVDVAPGICDGTLNVMSHRKAPWPSVHPRLNVYPSAGMLPFLRTRDHVTKLLTSYEVTCRKKKKKKNSSKTKNRMPRTT